VKVYNTIIREGKMTRGSIGIRFSEDPAKTPALLDVYGGVKKGIFVEDVIKGSPAEKAGMKNNDVIVSINGKGINKGQELIDMVADSAIGSSLKVAIMRDKKPMTLEVMVADRAKTINDNPVVSQNSGGDKASPEGVQKFGITIGPLSISDKQGLGYTGTGSVEVQSVEPDSFADGIGLAKGDILLEVNRQAVNSPEDVKRIQASLKPGDSVAFHVARQAGGNTRGGGNWQPLFLAGKLTAQGSN
jgi:serine protease Do